MAFRGDNESLSSSNKEHFLELVELVGQYDSVFKLHLDNIKEKQGSCQKPQVSLLSNRIQNDLIRAMAIYVKREILKEVREASIF